MPEFCVWDLDDGNIGRSVEDVKHDRVGGVQGGSLESSF